MPYLERLALVRRGCAALLCIACVGSAQTVLRVKVGAAGTADGSSWPNAFPDLQAVLAALAAAGGEVWVAGGTYRPGPAGATAATVLTLDQVRVYG